MGETLRLFDRATGAFVDSEPVDWTALRSRARRRRERALVDNLRVIAAMRGQHSAAPRFTRASAAASIVAGWGAGQTVAFLAVLAAAWARGGVPDFRAAQLVLAVAFGASCGWLAFAARRDPRRLFLIAIFACAASAFARSAAASALPRALERALAGVWIEAFLPACAWEFALDFPDVPRFTAFDRFGRIAAAVAWALGALLFVANAALPQHVIDAFRMRVMLHGDPAHWFWHLLTLALAPALAAIVVRARRAPASERRKVARLAMAVGGGLAPFICLDLARITIPGVDRWFRFAGGTGREAVYTLVLAALAATPIFSTAAVLVDGPFELQSRRSGGSSYAVAASGLSAVAIALLVLPLFTGVGGPLYVISAAICLLACARLVARISGAAGGTRARGSARIATTVERMADGRGAREKAAILATELRAGVGAEHARILTPAPDGGFADWSRAPLRLREGGALLALLKRAPKALDLSPAGALLPLLPQEEREWAVGSGVRVLAPVRHRSGRLLGVAAVGEKRGGFPIDRTDVAFIAASTAAAAAMWDADEIVSAKGHSTRARSTASEPAFECPRCGVVRADLPLSCGCDADPVVAALPLRVSAKFVVERRLGAGGCGVVYLARDAMLDRHVALKTLAHLRGPAIDRLRQEARAMAALNHPYLATLYGLELWRGAPVLVTEFLARGTLAGRLAAGVLSPREAVSLGLRLAEALAYMHEKGVVHRDLKPSNIGFDDAGVPKVLDFGLATLVAQRVVEGESNLDDGPFGGTRSYLPPGAWGELPDPLDDLWALAIVMVETLTGTNPLARARAAVGLSSFEAVEECLESVDLAPPLRVFLRRALSRPALDRFQTAGELLGELVCVAEHLGN